MTEAGYPGKLASACDGNCDRLHELHASGITIVVVTHEMDIAIQADRMIHMKDGKIAEDTAVDERRRGEILADTQEFHKRMFRQKVAALADPRLAKQRPGAKVIREQG